MLKAVSGDADTHAVHGGIDRSPPRRDGERCESELSEPAARNHFASESKPRRELNTARRARADRSRIDDRRNLAEQRRREVYVRVPKLRVIEDVEDLHAEHQ